ncbi:hypothetical protein [Rathayibacter soli]|uniref:hypothetical protein n=1 Tax=Rathayibacter soli TaxID=3144168 RepID=UPI0027E43203|nr:hypothetical protein [Glaciibacter superstes]
MWSSSALGIAALAVSRPKDTYLGVKYRRIATRRGPIKAAVAIERAIGHMLSSGRVYLDPRADYYTRLEPQKGKNRAIRQLETLGYRVVISPVAA